MSERHAAVELALQVLESKMKLLEAEDYKVTITHTNQIGTLYKETPRWIEIAMLKIPKKDKLNPKIQKKSKHYDISPSLTIFLYGKFLQFKILIMEK
jgi:hypothetical protein